MEASNSPESDETIQDQQFYHQSGFSYATDVPLNFEQLVELQTKANKTDPDHHGQHELVNVYLQSICSYLKELERAYIRCSAKATILHLKKLVATRILNGMERHEDIDMLCNGELLQDGYTLKFIFATRWKIHDPTLILQYRRKIEA